jgi:hypothetical protein
VETQFLHSFGVRRLVARATHPIDGLAVSLAALLVVAGADPASSSRLASQPASRTLGHVQPRFLASISSDDITHPVPDLTGYITEGQLVLSRELRNQGLYPPPVAVRPSLSRLMKDGMGKNATRQGPPRVADQLFYSYARAGEVHNLAAIIGAEELSRGDRDCRASGEAFEARFVNHGEGEDRAILETLSLAWDPFSAMPLESLTRVTEENLPLTALGRKARVRATSFVRFAPTKRCCRAPASVWSTPRSLRGPCARSQWD